VAPDGGACWRRPFGDDRFAAAAHPHNPVTQISAADAAAYCAWSHARLPTIVEWEVAARAGSTHRYPWGDTLMPHGVAMCNVWEGRSHLEDDTRDGFLYLAPVKSFPPNGWGLYDVIGNVFEYCADGVSTLHPEEASRLTTVRGGSWWCSANACHAYNLVDIGQMDRHASFANQGFRVARSVASGRAGHAASVRFELDVPVRHVQEVPPRLVGSVREREAEERVPLGLHGRLDEAHAGLVREPVPLAVVAGEAAADDVVPARASSRAREGSRDRG
jgi:hypothetical protein